MTIERHELNVSTTGSAGSATGSAILSLPISELLAVYVDFHGNAPATTDTTISSPGNPASVTILTLTNVNTDAWYYPKLQKHDNVGAAITGDYTNPLIHGNLLIDLAQCDALTNALVATVYVRT